MAESAQQRRAAVFGGTGFLGRAVVKRLEAEGAVVRVAARNPHAGALPAGVETVAADLRDGDSVARAVASRSRSALTCSANRSRPAFSSALAAARRWS